MKGIGRSPEKNSFDSLLYGNACINGTAPPAFESDPTCPSWRNGLLLAGLKA
jgi:hypothetical protein